MFNFALTIRKLAGTMLPSKFSDQYVERLLKKPVDVFKTKQIYYALSEHGSLNAKLSQPRPLNTQGVNSLSAEKPRLQGIKWPLNMQVVSERVTHKKFIPKSKEPLYRPNGQELQPKAMGWVNNESLVYVYEPDVGKYLDTTTQYGSIVPTLPQTPRTTDCLQFESRFESGNLQKAIRTGPNDYELYLRPDLYTKKYTQWFYFRISNTRTNRTYRFTVVNFYKATSLFSQGMRPLMYSEKAAKRTETGWHRVGNNIQYYPTHWDNESNPGYVAANSMSTGSNQANNPSSTVHDPRLSHTANFSPSQSHPWYSLTWTFEFPYDDDVVYFASCYPYTYSQLRDYLAEIKRDPYRNRVCQQTELCRSFAGNSVPLLTITEPEQRAKSALITQTNDRSATVLNSDSSGPLRKQCVVITARVHPGETQSSWIVQGLLDFLLSKHPDAEVLRENFVFKVVPMLNPDGVIVGNYRCSLSGCDINRKYTSDLKRFFPTVWHTKRMVLEMMCDYPVLVYCDLHGHSRKQHMFIYGCRHVDPGSRFLDRVFPLMLSRNAPDLFDYDKCRFGIQREKEGTGRISMWREGVTNSYTLEATFCGSGGDQLTDGYHFNYLDYEQMGRQFCETLLDFCDPDVAKREYVMAELERLRNVARARHEASGADSPSSYSSEDSSDTGSDSSNCDNLPTYYAELLENKPKRQTKRKSLFQRQRDTASHSMVPKIRPALFERSVQCAACQKDYSPTKCQKTASIHVHRKTDLINAKMPVDKLGPNNRSSTRLETKIVNSQAVYEARWLGGRRSSISCPETPRLEQDRENQTACSTENICSVEDTPNAKLEVSNFDSETKKFTRKRTSSAPTRGGRRRQKNPKDPIALDSISLGDTITSPETATALYHSDRSTKTCNEESVDERTTNAFAFRFKQSPTPGMYHTDVSRPRLCFRPTTRLASRFLSSEQIWTPCIGNKNPSPSNSVAQAKLRSSRNLGVRASGPHSPDLSSLILTGRSIPGIKEIQYPTGRFSGATRLR